MSQQELASAINVAPSTVGGWESGNREPDFKTLISIAIYLNVSSDYLLGLSDNPEPEQRSIDSVALNNFLTTFIRPEFEGLTPEEINALANIAVVLKKLRSESEQITKRPADN